MTALPPSLDPADADVAAALAWLGSRHSVGARYLVAPAPTTAQWQAAVEVALRAPDHGRLRPFRFVRVGDAQREHLATLFVADARRRGLGDADAARAHERAHHGPALVAVVARIRDDVDEVPAIEQWMSVGGGIANLLDALHLMGFGAKVVSGPSVRDPAIRAAFCADDETLAAWVVAGTPSRRPHPKGQAEPRRAAWSEWEPGVPPTAG